MQTERRARKSVDANSQQLGDNYYLKAMNCPHHHKLFAALPRSYRELPLRLAEYGTDYRYEKSGELFGLMRVRSLQMNDAHLYMTPEQFEAEFNAVNEMYLNYFKLFGIDKYLMRFSTHDPAKLGQKFVNEPELWKKTEEMTRNVLKNSGINYVEVPNEAAFYGPKIDVQAWSVIGREFSIATNQVDFAQPRSFDLRYKDRDNIDKIPICIHRAPLGTHERFIGFLIEHYAGNFPLWLSPEQVRILTIGDDPKLLDYARSILKELRAHQVRAEMDESSDKINGKIQRAEQMKVHTMFVIGKRDMEAPTPSVCACTEREISAPNRETKLSQPCSSKSKSARPDRSMEFLLNWPWALSFFFVSAVTTTIAVLGLYLVRKKYPADVLKENHEVAAIIFNAFGVLYAVVVAFVVFVTWNGYDEATKNLQLEASQVLDIFHSARAFPDPASKIIQDGLIDYTNSVHNDELRRMAGGDIGIYSTGSLRNLIAVFDGMNDKSIPNRELYMESLRRINNLAEYRRLRIFAGNDTVPPMVWLILLVGGLITVSYTYFFGVRNIRGQYIMTSALTIMISLILFLVYVLDHPFTGTGRVSARPFSEAMELMQKEYSEPSVPR